MMASHDRVETAEPAMNPSLTFDLTQSDGFVSSVYGWMPERAPKAVVQLAHGMGEYATRYSHPIAKLNAAGYAVLANDHRGHGPAALENRTLGDFGPAGFPRLVDDMSALSDEIRRRHPGLPLFLLGHSMGSFASQLYVLGHAAGLAGLVLSGSSALDVMAQQFATVELVDGEFPNVLNAPFEPSRTPFDWLSRDTAQVDAYIASPLCGFAVTPESFGSLLASGASTGDPALLQRIPKDLPVYIFSGDRDPVGGNTALLDILANRYRDIGLREVQTRYYPEARHEMLNEVNRDEVIADLVRWLDAHLPCRP